VIEEMPGNVTFVVVSANVKGLTAPVGTVNRTAGVATAATNRMGVIDTGAGVSAWTSKSVAVGGLAGSVTAISVELRLAP